MSDTQSKDKHTMAFCKLSISSNLAKIWINIPFTKAFAQELTYFPMHNCTWKCQFARLRAVECHYPVYYVHIIKWNSCETATDIQKCIKSRQYSHRFHTANFNTRLIFLTFSAAASTVAQKYVSTTCSSKICTRNLSALKYNRRKWTWRIYNGLKMAFVFATVTAYINTATSKCQM